MLQRIRIAKPLLLGLIVALVLVGVKSPATYALDNQEMTIAPTDKHYSVDPGEVISDDFVILNSGNVPYDFRTYSAPYSVSDTSYSADSSKEGGRADAYKWVQFKDTTYHADVRETVKIPFTIRVSPYASPGGHYGIIFAEQQPTAKATGTGVTRTIRMGMVVYINVKGNAKTEGGVKSIGVPWFQPSAPLTGEMLINNTGQTDFPVTASFVVSDLFGNVKYTQKISDTYILPGAPRALGFSWNNSPWFGLYRVQVGAEVLGKSTVRESYVVIAPRWLLFIVGLVLLLGVIRAVQARSNRHSAPRS